MSDRDLYRAPTGSGQVLAVPPLAEYGNVIARNRMQLAALPQRREAIADTLKAACDYHLSLGELIPCEVRPEIIVSGHQPEFFHPGVWIKNFALNRVATEHRLTPLNLIVDTDLIKSTTIAVPRIEGDTCHIDNVPFDEQPSGVIFEGRPVMKPELIGKLYERIDPHWDIADPRLPIHPLCYGWTLRKPLLGDGICQIRRITERKWGCNNLELPISLLAETPSFKRFVAMVLDDLPRFREIYNGAVREYRTKHKLRSKNHPVPELGENAIGLETPFWLVDRANSRRESYFYAKGTAFENLALRPKALMTTLYARVFLGVGFIHGIGGGKYDEVTDCIIQRWLGIEPPRYGVVSATVHLPLPWRNVEADAYPKHWRLRRDLEWNPQRFVTDDPETRRKAALISAEPAEHAARRRWFRDLQNVTAELRKPLAGRIGETEQELKLLRERLQAQKLVRSREYSWILFPEEVLKPIMQSV